MTKSMCNIDITRNGRIASATVSFPARMRYAAQMNYLILTHDRAGQAFAAAAEEKRAHAAYDAASHMMDEVNQ